MLLTQREAVIRFYDNLYAHSYECSCESCQNCDPLPFTPTPAPTVGSVLGPPRRFTPKHWLAMTGVLEALMIGGAVVWRIL